MNTNRERKEMTLFMKKKNLNGKYDDLKSWGFTSGKLFKKVTPNFLKITNFSINAGSWGDGGFCI